MRIFVTGGSGYLGQATIRALRAHGHDVVALARTASAAQKVRALGAVPVSGGLTDLDVLRDAAGDADAAIHLAAADADTAALDLTAAGAMQDALGDRPYVHTGGVWVYGDTAGVVDETAPQSPPPVTAWRWENEKRVLDRGHPVLVMPGVVYGHGQGLIAEFLAKPARSGAAHWIGAGTNRWAVVHVDDIAELYALAPGAPAGRTYAGVDAQTPTMRELAEAVSAGAGHPGTATSIPLDAARAEFGSLTDAFALDQRLTSARARTELGWTPRSRDILAELAQP